MHAGGTSILLRGFPLPLQPLLYPPKTSANQQPVHFASVALDPDALVLVRMTGREEVSRLFHYELELRPRHDPNVVQEARDTLLRAPACLEIGQGRERVWGVIRQLEDLPLQVLQNPTYRFHFVPRLWWASLVFRSRVYQNMSVPEIVHSVFTELGWIGGADFVLRLSDRYPTREYTVQYEETNLDFLSRLMEEEGIFYIFEHDDERDCVVLLDQNQTTKLREEHQDVPYLQPGGRAPGEMGVTALSRSERLVPQTVVVVDYNWRTPLLPLTAEAPVDPNGMGAEVHVTEHYLEPARGNRLARLRGELIASRRVRYAGTSDLVTLHAGDQLSVVGHPSEEFCRTYFVTGVDYSVTQRFEVDGESDVHEDAYRNEFEAISLETPFRPELLTSQPRIHGSVYATVDGPDTGLEAPIDDQGRYKIILPFDSAEPGKGRASCWVRAQQPLSGPNYGIHFPMRVGAEVLLTHIHGDPDRPLIVGGVPNVITPSPTVRANASQSIIRTASGITVQFEDHAKGRS